MTAGDGDDDRSAGSEMTGTTDDSPSTSADSGRQTNGEDSRPMPDGSGGTRADGGNVSSEVELPDPEEGPGFEGAPDDEEMPLTEHIEEMLSRMLAVAVVMVGVAIPVSFVAHDIINFLWYSFLPSPEGGITQCGTVQGDSVSACPRVYKPLGLLIARLKVASLAGFVIALPVFVYQTYLFMRPGLYRNERRYYLAAVPTSLLLALVGLAFSYFFVLPLIFEYFLFYSEDVADIAFGLGDTFTLILMMMGLFALIFQIPLFIMLAIMMGVTSRAWLEDRRLLFWFSFASIAFLFSPDPTGMAPFIVAATMIVLFEFTLGLLRWTGR